MRLGSQIRNDHCAELRAVLKVAKWRRDDVIAANAQADNEARPWPTSGAELVAARRAVDVAALQARRAGCDVDDLVGPDVGHRG
jgi:hypothetical protein